MACHFDLAAERLEYEQYERLYDAWVNNRRPRLTPEQEAAFLERWRNEDVPEGYPL